MPDLKDHLATARRFRSLYDKVPAEYPDGRALCLFYSALHYVEAVAASAGRHCRVHRDREDFIRRSHGKMWKYYHPLWSASEQARYLAGGAFIMNSDAVEHYLRKSNHHCIERWAEAELGITQAVEPKPAQSEADIKVVSQGIDATGLGRLSSQSPSS